MLFDASLFAFPALSTKRHHLPITLINSIFEYTHLQEPVEEKLYQTRKRDWCYKNSTGCIMYNIEKAIYVYKVLIKARENVDAYNIHKYIILCILYT